MRAACSDVGGVFKANVALELYQRLGIEKRQIKRRRPWQNYVESSFNNMKRLEAYKLEHARSGRSSVQSMPASSRTTTTRNTSRTRTVRMACARRLLSCSPIILCRVEGECCYIGIVTVRFVAKRTERCWSSGNEASSIKAMAVL